MSSEEKSSLKRYPCCDNRSEAPVLPAYYNEKPPVPLLYLAAADYAAHYRAEDLSADDAERARCQAALHQNRDWQTSRALLALCADAPHRSISHTKGCAAVFAAASVQAGTDLEQMKIRDFSVWRRWVCTAAERRWLEAEHRLPAAYYALWTLKESLLKACGMELADIRRVGLAKGENGRGWRLHGGGQEWQGGVWLLGRDLAAAAVWPPHEPPPRIVRKGRAERFPLRQLYRFGDG